MFVLLVLLFLGSGFALWRFINFLTERNKTMAEPGQKLKQKEQVKTPEKGNGEVKNVFTRGGLFMANNSWVKLAIFSLVGVLVSVIVLSFISTGNSQGMQMGTMGTNGQGINIHQQHQQQGMQQNGMGGMNMQGGMNVNSQMGNMQMQGGMNMNGGMDQNQLMMMQQQLYQMQMQLNQMRQQMWMNGNGQMQGGMNNMPNNGMNNMNNMNNMQQNNGNMNNMQQNGGNSNGGGMSMM